MFLDSIAPLVTILFLLKYNKGKMRGELLPLCIFLLVQFVFNTTADVFSYLAIPNYFLYRLCLPLSFLAQLYFFRALKTKIFFTSPLFIAGIVLVAVFIASSLFFEKINTYNDISYILKSLYILLICLRYYWRKVHTDDDSSDILQQPSFWFISGFFIYYCSCFIVYASFNAYLIHNNQLANIIWYFQNIIYLIMCILLVIGVKKNIYAH